MSNELPKGWQLVRIVDVCDVNPRDPLLHDSAEISFVPMAAVDEVTATISSPQIRQFSEVRTGFTSFADGDVLFAKITPCMENGKAAVAENLVNGRGYGSTEFFVLRSRGAIVPAYLHRFVRQNSYRKAARATMKSGVGQARVPRQFVEETEVPLPPLNEQKRIVAKLEGLQARSRRAREALDAVPAALEKLRQSILAAAFRGDLTKDWRAKNKDVEPASKLLERIRVERRKKWEEAELAKLTAKGKAPKDDKWKSKYKEPTPIDTADLPELPEGWCWASIGELADVGTGATPKRGEAKYYDSGTIPWVTSGALNDDFVSKATELVTEHALAETNLRVYPPGTLLLAMYGEGKTRGMVSELRIEATTNQAISAILLEGRASILKDLIRLALLQKYADIRKMSMGGVQPNLNLEKVRNIPIPICSELEIQLLAAVLSRAIDQLSLLTSSHRNTVASLDRLEQAILAKAFRGELVPQDPNDEPAATLLARTTDTQAPTAQRKRGRPSRSTPKAHN